MSVLYLIDQGATLQVSGGRLIIKKHGQTLQWLHASKLEQVAIMGNVSLTPQAIAFLLETGIDTVFLTRSGRYRGRLASREGKNILVRRQQFRRLDDPAFELDLARRFVRGKLVNCRYLLSRRTRGRYERDVKKAIHRIRYCESRLNDAASLDEVRGWEGNAAAAYFPAVGQHLVPEEFRFTLRSKRPPRDAFNSMLSFGYALLLGTISASVQTVGLDPYLGALHAPDNGKPSLVLDLMEEFRPVLVDALALKSVSTRQIVPADFRYQPEADLPAELDDELPPEAPDEYPVLFARASLPKWITLYEARLRRPAPYARFGVSLALRQICLEQARLLARHFQGEEEYVPFGFR
ncbi:CRISPR-associated endonuclease Cas1 [bacterium CPR1]|nr:CRISPR-associated endonuclease Cas1 [bacterium CPR1]